MPRRLAVGKLDDGFFDVVGELDGQEPIPRVEVVLAFLIDDANHVVLQGFGVFEELVNLQELEGFLVLVVADANSEPGLGRNGFASNRGTACA